MSDIREMAAHAGYFSIVLWQDEDIIEALANNGIEPTSENVQKLRDMIDEDDMCSYMIERGWDYIEQTINLSDESEWIA